MKIDGITLLQMIKEDKIKPNTKIKVTGGYRTHHSYAFFGENKILYWKSENGLTGQVVLSDELLKYEFEIIEENTKIEEIILSNNRIVSNLNEEVKYIDTNLKDREIYIKKINELIRAVNYLLEKSDK